MPSPADAGLHSLRHTFVSLLVERNVPVTIAAELVGHSRETMTHRYTHVRGGKVERVERMREMLA